MSLSEPDAAFLADRNLAFLFARRPDGSPVGWPMTSVLTGDGLTFSTYANVIVEQSPSYYQIGYIGIAGGAERIRDMAGRLAFDLTPCAVTSASFAKLAEPAD